MRNLTQGIAERRRGPQGQRRCSFCRRSESQVARLIAGPGVYICDGCVEFCNEILEKEQTGGRV